MLPQPSDEGPHLPGPDARWEESWQIDFAVADASLGGCVRLGLRDGRAWYWVHLVGRGRDLVAVRDHDVDAPRGRALELRGTGLWAELTCETPLDHWSTGLEAFGIALSDPAEAYGDERGHPVAVGLDLEWEAGGATRAWSDDDANGYTQPGDVHGEVLVGEERIDVVAQGWRTHEWGPRHWWTAPAWGVRGRLDDGATFAVHGSESGAALDLAGNRPDLPTAGTVLAGDDRYDLVTLAHAPVLIPGPHGRAGRLWRGLVRVTAGDGRVGTGWCESLRPA